MSKMLISSTAKYSRVQKYSFLRLSGTQEATHYTNTKVDTIFQTYVLRSYIEGVNLCSAVHTDIAFYLPSIANPKENCLLYENT